MPSVAFYPIAPFPGQIPDISTEAVVTTEPVVTTTTEPVVTTTTEPVSSSTTEPPVSSSTTEPFMTTTEPETPPLSYQYAEAHATSLSVTVDIPLGVPGDQLYIMVVNANSSNYLVPTPTDWSSAYDNGAGLGGGNIFRQQLFTKVADGTEPTSITLTYSGGTATTIRAVAVRVSETSGQDGLSSQYVNNNSSPAVIVAPSITTSVNGDLLLMFGADQRAAGSGATSTDLSLAVDYNGQDPGAALFDGSQPVAGATGAKTITMHNAYHRGGILVALKPLLGTFTNIRSHAHTATNITSGTGDSVSGGAPGPDYPTPGGGIGTIPHLKLLAFLMHRSPITSVPAGWNLVASSGSFSTSGTAQYTSVYEKDFHTGDDLTAHTWVQSANGRMVLSISSYYDINGIPVAITASATDKANNGGSIASAPAAQVTATQDGQMIVAGMSFTAVAATPNLAPPAGYTPVILGTVANQRLMVGYRQALEAEVSNGNFALASTNTGYGGVSVLLGKGAPFITTEPFETTTEPPFVTTTEPVTTTTEPFVTTTEPPSTTTEPPFETTTEPLFVTTTEPFVTTTEPFVTTTEPMTTTEPPLPAPIVVSSTNRARNATSTLATVVNVPTHVTGDLLVAFVAAGGNNAGDAVPVETGWTKLTDTTATYGKASAYWRVCGASEPSTYSFTTSGRTSAVMISVRGQNVSPVDAFDKVSSGALTPTSVDLPTVTATTASDLLLGAVARFSPGATVEGGSAFTSLGGLTLVNSVGASNTNGSFIAAGQETLTASGGIATHHVTASVNRYMIAFSLLIKP